MNSGAAFSQIRRVIDLERRCFFSARWRGDKTHGSDSLWKVVRLADLFEITVDELINPPPQGRGMEKITEWRDAGE